MSWDGIYAQDRHYPQFEVGVIKNGEHFYKAKDSDWEMNGELVKDNWYETELTKSLNREEKLNKLGIV
jgi:hypothetical protein